MHSVKKLLKLLHPFRGKLNQIYILAILQSVFYLLIPLGVQAIVTYSMIGKMSASLILLCSLTIIAVIFIGLFQLWQMRINESIQQNILTNVAIKFSEKISNLKPDLYLSNYLPAKINQFFDVLTLQKGLTKIVLDFSFSLLSIVIGAIVLSVYNAVFLLFALIIGFVFYLLIREYGKRSLKTSLNESTQKYLFVDWLQKLYELLKSNNTEATKEYIFDNTNQTLLNYIEEKNKMFKILDIQYKSILIFKTIFTAIVLFLGVWLVQSGKMTIGQFLTCEIIVIIIINAVEKLVLNLQTVYDVLTATEKLYQIFELDENIEQKQNRVNKDILKKIKAKIYHHTYSKKIRVLIYSLVTIGFAVLIMPWNQTIECEGKVSSLNPSDRPQTIPSRISGRIEKWFVTEGKKVKRNDTIAFISEVKEDYLDPKLMERTQVQIDSKESSIKSYENKINSINSQIDAINKLLPLKIEQLKNKLKQSESKVISDSIEYFTSLNNYTITEEQFKRYEQLLGKGVISKTDLENRKTKVQDGYAKKISAENKWVNSKNELLNIAIEFNSIKQEYNEKLMKLESEKFSGMSMLYDAEAGLSKMQNQYSNYSIRNSYYYVTAPQDGYIIKSYVNGVGDIVKEGAALVSFTPIGNDLSIEFFIEPVDLPLVSIGMDIQMQFDGWPALVFSGWPGVSFGTYHATVISIDKVISENGKVRLLAKKGKENWPTTIQIGSGVKGLALLKKVPVAYELWRKSNGFPPEFYTTKNKMNTGNEKTK